MEMMRAARLVARGKVVCERVPVPALQIGQALVRTHYTAVSGGDLRAIYAPAVLPPYPLPAGYPGHAAVGEVVVSTDPALAAGERVLCAPTPPQACTFAEYIALDASHCVPLLDEAERERERLLAQQLGSVLLALTHRPLEIAGKTCVVLGQGAAGLFFSALLKRAGAARVIASDLTHARRATASRFGCDECVAPDELSDAVLDETCGRGAELVVDAAGSEDAFAQLPELVALDGSLLCYGLPTSQGPVALDYPTLFRKRAALYTAYGGPEEPGLVSVRRALELIESRTVDVRALLTHTYAIEQIQTGLQRARDRDDGALKVCVSFASPDAG